MSLAKSTVVVAIVLLMAGSTVAIVTIAGADVAPESGTKRVGTQGGSTAATTAASADPLSCTNGTSSAVLACGFNPGPTSVELSDQASGGQKVRLRAVELDEGGFIAVHRRSFVDGEFTGSVVGTSRYLSPGLHEHVVVELDEPVEEDQQLVAVAYHDSDEDRHYDFAGTDGADDRPYTNSYSEETGNVTDEAGDVIGDVASVTVVPVSLSINDGVGQANGTASLEFTITNTGSEPISSLGLRLTRIAPFSLAAIDSPGGSPAMKQRAVFWTSPVAPGESVTATYTLRVPTSQSRDTYTVSALVSTGDGEEVTASGVVAVRGTSPAVVAIAGPDGQVSFDEVMQGIALFNTGETAPGTDEPVTFQDVLRLIELFDTGAQI